MRIHLFLLCALVPCLSGAQQSVPPKFDYSRLPERPDPEEKIQQAQVLLAQLNKAKKIIDNSARKNADICQNGGPCSFRELCLELQKNRNSPTLYRNGRGEELMNPQKLALDRQINLCLNNIIAHKAEAEQAALASKQPGENAPQQSLAQAQTAFLKAVNENGEASNYLKIQIAMVEISADRPPIDALPRKIHDLIEQAQKRAGVRLSEKSLRLWRESLSPLNPKLGIEKVNSKPLQFQNISTGNPYFEPHLLFNDNLAGGPEKRSAYVAEFEAHEKRVRNIFDQVKSAILRVLESRKTSSNRSAIKNLTKRIHAVTLQTDPSKSLSSVCSMPNAYYSPETNIVQVCPQNMNAPYGSLTFLLAHEIGHAIDPCNMAHDLHKTTGSFYEQVMPEVADDIKRPASPAAKGIPFGQNPFGPVLKCLADPQKSIGAKSNDPEDLFHSYQELSTAKRASGGEEFKDMPEMHDYIKKYAACSFNENLGGSKSQLGEAFSDWLSGEVVQAIMAQESDPGRKRELALEAMMTLSSRNCVGVAPEIPPKALKILPQVGCFPTEIEEIGVYSPKPLDDDHPLTYKRVDHVLLASPPIADALGCPTTQGKVRCE